MNLRMLLFFFAAGVCLMACSHHPPTDLSKEDLIPKPVSVIATADAFEITRNTNIVIGSDSPELQFIAHYLADRLMPATGFDLEVSSEISSRRSRSFYFTLTTEEDVELGDEGYEINISSDQLMSRPISLPDFFGPSKLFVSCCRRKLKRTPFRIAHGKSQPVQFATIQAIHTEAPCWM